MYLKMVLSVVVLGFICVLHCHTAEASQTGESFKANPPRDAFGVGRLTLSGQSKQPKVAQDDSQRPLYYRRGNPRRGTLIAGISLLSSGYGISLLVGTIGVSIGHVPTAMLLVPVAGPFVSLGLGLANGGGIGVAIASPFLVLLGLMQVTGLVLVIVGATGPRRIPVYRDPADRYHRDRDDRRDRDYRNRNRGRGQISQAPPLPAPSSKGNTAQALVYNLGSF